MGEEDPWTEEEWEKANGSVGAMGNPMEHLWSLDQVLMDLTYRLVKKPLRVDQLPGTFHKNYPLFARRSGCCRRLWWCWWSVILIKVTPRTAEAHATFIHRAIILASASGVGGGSHGLHGVEQVHKPRALYDPSRVNAPPMSLKKVAAQGLRRG